MSYIKGAYLITKKSRFFLLLAEFIIIASTGSCWSQAEPRPLVVSIFAVNQFEDPALNADKDLNNAITDAAQALKRHFERAYNVAPDVYVSQADTRSTFIRTWLFKDLAHDSRKAVHVVFFLTHGFAQSAGEPTEHKGDIFLAASDTFEKAFVGTAIRGGELIEAFRQMPQRATIFLFLDSCGSGAIDSTNLQRTLEEEPDFASRLFLLSAAMPDQLAYRARFSETLVNVWEAHQNNCHKGSAIEKFLTEEMKKIPGVSAKVDQNVRVVSPFNPDFCIESFSQTQHILMLFNGAPGDTLVTLQRSTGEFVEVPPLRKKGELVPLFVAPDRYTLTAKHKLLNVDDQDDVRTVDLTAQPADVKVLFSTDPLDNDDALNKSAAYLESRALFGTTAENFRKQAASDVETRIKELENHLMEISRSEISALLHIQNAEQIDVQRSSEVTQADAQMAVVVGRAAADGAAYPPVGPGELEESTKKYQMAIESSKNTEDEIRKLRNIYNTLEITRAKLDEKMLASGRLKASVEAIESNHNRTDVLEQAIKQEIDKHFLNTRINDRGVVISLPNSNEQSQKNLKKYESIVALVKQYPSLQAELELTAYGSNSLQEQQKVRKRATELAAAFIRLGMPPDTIVSRGKVKLKTPQQDEQSAQIEMIVSPRAGSLDIK